MTDNEVGRELKVSQLKPHTVVCLHKEGRNAIVTFWVDFIGPEWVGFYAGAGAGTTFLAMRTGENKERITDDSGVPMKIFEYLGEI